MPASIRHRTPPRRLAVLGLAWLTLALAPPSRARSEAVEQPSTLVLERVVIVARHGVRSPTRAPAALARYAAQPWAEWPVGPGELTPHGAADVRLMAAWFRRHYAALRLLPPAGCPAAGEVDVIADGKDQRTRLSGEAWVEGAFPGCPLVARHGPEGETDPLFDAVASGACPMDAEAARVAVLARVGGDLDRPDGRYPPAKAALGAILDSAFASRPCVDTAGACVLTGVNTLQVRDGALRLQGPLATGATLAENLMLEWAQGMAPAQVGWGRAGSEAAIAAVMPLHEIEAGLMRRTPYIAAHNGAVLARTVATALDGPARLLIIVGHDSNLDNLAGILGLDWSLPGQPDRTAPDTALVFEVWRDPGAGARSVRLAVVGQTLAQLRAEAPLDAADPPVRVVLTATGCGRDCSVEALRANIRTAVPAACAADRPPAVARRPD